MSTPPEQLSDTSLLGGTFQMPDTSALDQQITDERKVSQGLEAQSAAQSERAADLAEQQAQQLQQQQGQFDQLLKQYPTRQVAYGMAMHTAPILAIMTALGGRMTRLNGMEMLGATNGIMKGLNAGAEEQFKESLDKWNAAYQRQKDLFAEQQRAQQLMLSAYQGRADAYQKASEAARRWTGDLLEQKQEKIKNQMDLFQMQQSQAAQLDQSARGWAHIAVERQKAGDFEGKVQQLLAAMAAKGYSPPAGFRSAAEKRATAQGLLERYPEKTPDEIVDMLAAAKREQKVADTEATVAARKEASVGSAILTLNNQGGLYDQLDVAAKRVNFGDAKVASKIRLAVQGQYVDDPAIQYYVSKIQETRAELAQVFSRTGQATDTVRAMAAEALPIAASYDSLKEAIRSSREAADAVNAGNTAFIESLKRGEPLKKALAEEHVKNPPTFNTAAEAEQAAQQGTLRPGDRVIVNGVPGTWEQ